jgi:type I restriction enzyme S subunit
MSVENLITEHLDIWTSAIKSKSAAGRGSSKKLELVGVKKLRELILELAVCGKLVPQDPNDEPASELLKKIEAEKVRLVKEGKIKKPKPLPKIVADELPCELPNSWMWARLGNITNYGHCDKIEAKDASHETWVLELEDVEKETSKLLQKKRFFEREFKSSKNVFVKGDVIYGKLRPYLDKVLVADESGVCTTEMIPVRAYKEMLPEFLRLSMKSPNFKEYANNSTHGMNLPRMGTDKAKLALIPTCSLKEQHRIVAKVDELMALCDQLEAQTESSIDAHKTLVEVLLATLTDAKDADELNDNWQTISQHFDVLFTTQAAISQLKQTILQLAVMGKLVKQDPNDEPASKLLERLNEERSHWLKENSGDNPECRTMVKKLSKLSEAKAPFSIPDTWGCVHLIQISRLLVDCHNKTAPYVDSGIPIIRTTNIRNRVFNLAGVKYVNNETYDYWSRRCPPGIGDIMFTREAPMGEAAIIPDGVKWCLGQRTMLIRPMHDYVSVKYLLLALTEPHLLERASEHAIGSTVKHLRVGDVENLNLPWPPLEEQHRIATKAEELMALCDSLKARLNQAQNTQLHLTDAIVEQRL